MAQQIIREGKAVARMGSPKQRPSRREVISAAAGLAAVPATPEPSAPATDSAPFEPIRPPDWVFGITRMAFLTAGQLADAAKAGVQVVHTNLVWPYFPLRRDGGGLAPKEAKALHDLCDSGHRYGMRIVLGLPPFPPVNLVQAHPDWRVHPADTPVTTIPREDDLGTRVGCNLGPWGDTLIAVCAELITDYGLDGFSFDGDYQPPLCFCPACKAAHRQERNRDIPPRIDLDDIAYREYLVWRGERHEQHYRRMQQAIKAANPNAVLISWSANAGRYGHFLTSPRVMTTRANMLFDIPMQEWWLDESNIGGSILPAFSAAYLRAVSGDRPCASEPYLMSRGNPYSSDSFPHHERRTRHMLALTGGNILAESFGWPGQSVGSDFVEVARQAKLLTRTRPLAWAGMLVSEQTRQFYAYKDIAERFLPPLLGAFRAASEEHLPLSLLNDWNINPQTLARYAVLLLPNAAALSDQQLLALREYVHAGGGLVASGETSLCDALGRPRSDFALADLLGVSYNGRPGARLERRPLDPNFAIALDESYWQQRVGAATLSWSDFEAFCHDAPLRELAPQRSATFRGPQTLVSEPGNRSEVVARMTPEGSSQSLPAAIFRTVGAGRVVYLAAGLDAAMWSYAYPYQRRLLVDAVTWAARIPSPISIQAPMCVHATIFEQAMPSGVRLVIHLFNGLNTTGGHGLPAMDVPLREEIVPIHGIEIAFHRQAPTRLFSEPDHTELPVRRAGNATIFTMPPLEIHRVLAG
jgi:hypothetical protein